MDSSTTLVRPRPLQIFHKHERSSFVEGSSGIELEGVPPAAGAIAGVLGSDGGARAVRNRLAASLDPDGQPRTAEAGPLAYGWAGGAQRAELTAEGLICLLDGAIYNSAEIERRLAMPAGLEPAALLAHAYARVGPDLWPLLRGDFGILVWDREAGRGTLVRDQLGARGLFLHRTGSTIAFASEVRNLTRMLPRMPAPDDVAVAHWLVPAVVPEDRTFFAGIEEMPPATCLAFGLGGVRANRYWTPRYRPRHGLSEAEAATRARASLQRAVERRAAGRRSSAVLLSGGIDSASVAGFASRCLPEASRPARSYSAIFPRYPEIDESPLIGEIAGDCGFEATALEPDPGGLIAAAIPFIATWQAPPPTPNLYFLRPLLDRACSDEVRVLLDGEGGDAVFWHQASLLAERLRSGRPLSAWSLAGRFPEYGLPTTWRTRLGHLRQWGRARDFSPAPQQWLAVAPHLLESQDPEPPTKEGPPWWVAQVAGILGPGSRMAHDTTRRNSALSGIEPRHPLLDVDLIEEVLSFPPELAFDRRYNRPVLRDAVAGLVPERARLRPYKSNFDAMLIDGMVADVSLVEAMLLAPAAHIRAYTDREALKAHIEAPPDHLAGRRAWAMSLWNLATMECWLRVAAGEDPLSADVLGTISTPEYSFSVL
ncbi:MAG: asparagine synthase [Solirubrobacterales bacterium]|nr:asparagine synthase [Solirubrobacterales bacterium]